MEAKLEENNNEKSMDRDIFLALIIKELMGWTLDDMNIDGLEQPKRWEGITELAGEYFEQFLGRKPPKDFLTTTFRTPKD